MIRVRVARFEVDFSFFNEHGHYRSVVVLRRDTDARDSISIKRVRRRAGLQEYSNHVGVIALDGLEKGRLPFDIAGFEKT